MTRAADLIEALLARMPGRLILERRSGMPYGWGIWMRGRDSATPGFGEQELIATLQARTPAASTGIAPQLPWWQAFRQLWWQQWEPAPRDERPLHWASVAASALLHLLFAALLLWMALVHWAAPEPAPAEEGRVQLSLIGEGSPDSDGGGAGEPGVAAAAATTPATPRASSSASASARPAPAPVRAAPPQPSAPATPDAPQLQAPAVAEAEPASPPAPPQRQSLDIQRPEPAATPATAAPPPMVIDPRPLQATDTEVASSEFVVPPPPSMQMQVQAPRPQPAEPQVRERSVETVSDAPQVVALQPRELPAPTLPALPVASVREREVSAAPVPDVQLAMPQPRAVAPQLSLPEVAIRQREVREAAPPAPQPPAQTAVAEQAPAPPTAAVTSPSPAAAMPSPQPAPAPSTAAPSVDTGSRTTLQQPASGQAGARPAGTGPAPVDRSGGWATAKPGDDWGMGTRVQDGARQAGTSTRGEGLFNQDGSVRVPPGQDASEPPRGAPGGDTDSWSRDRIANSGTWLKRPPYDYTPTSFDRYWVPNESLLEEWVRQGIKKIEIAIPGTSTKISCVVSLLQFGGGCGLTNPNMQEQPAEARPPPDIPFKKELQEDNGSVR